MASPELDPRVAALLDKVEDPSERAALRKEMEASMLRQSDYSRKMNEWQATQKQYQEWYDANKSKYENMAKQLAEKEDALARFRNNPAPQEPELEVADSSGELEDGKVATMLKTALEEARAAKAEAEAIKAALAEHGVTKEYVDSSLRIGADKYGTSVFKTLEMVQKAQAEYGRTVTPEEVVKAALPYAGDPKAFEKGYRDLTAADAQKKLEDDIRRKVEAEVAARYSNTSVPLAGEGPGVNPLQAYLSAPAGEDGIPSNIKADGTGRLGAAIAAQLRAEGKY